MCLDCDSSCATCSSLDVCTSCVEGFTKSATKCLQCRSDEYVSVGDDKCVECGFGCSQCGETDSKCLQCTSDSYVNDLGQCECNKGFFTDLASGSCKQCDPGCADCASNDQCTACADGFTKGDTKCLACDSNQFIQGDMCLDCDSSCVTCSSLDVCTSCVEGFTKSATKCLQCRSDEYVSVGDDKCVECGFGCSQCGETDSKCLNCTTNSVPNSNGQCTCN
jgi:proprotein convertase subtilisin/kexin type 5